MNNKSLDAAMAALRALDAATQRALEANKKVQRETAALMAACDRLLAASPAPAVNPMDLN